jgi:hypothetical protein
MGVIMLVPIGLQIVCIYFFNLIYFVHYPAVITAVTELGHGKPKFYSTAEVITFCRKWRLPTNHIWLFSTRFSFYNMHEIFHCQEFGYVFFYLVVFQESGIFVAIFPCWQSILSLISYHNGLLL